MLVRQLWILLSLSHWNFEELSAIRNLSCRPSAQWTGWDYTAKLHSLHRWCCYGYLAKATSVTVHRPGHDQDLLDSNWVSMMCTACQKSLKPKCTTRYHTISQWLSLLSSPSCIILLISTSSLSFYGPSHPALVMTSVSVFLPPFLPSVSAKQSVSVRNWLQWSKGGLHFGWDAY